MPSELETAVKQEMKRCHWQLFTVCRSCRVFAWCAGNRRDTVKCEECWG